ncbi:DNA recombination protein RmuC, partial [Pseudomonas aeruginosa]|nr:DNA recombination protein RmuC [Pseudomonas aeruginosa]
ARLSGEVAALRREAELMGEERQRASQAEARWASERKGREEEVRRLASERAALAAELREQQESHQQRLTDLQSARDELRAQFAELAGKIFDER